MNSSKPISINHIVPVALVLLLAFGVLVPKVHGQANVTGKWSTLSYTMPINPVHTALLANGKILVVAGSGNCPPSQSGCPSGPPYGPSNGSGALLLNPATGAITQFSVSWDMFCNGMVLLPDGRAFINGGTIQYDPFLGQLSSAIFDPASNTFTNAQNMAHGRWYPTVLTLGDGRVMTFSGLSETGGGTNTAVEIYTLGAGWSTQYIAPWTPPLYPRMHLLPNGQVFYSGSTTGSALFDPSSNSWTQNVASTNYCCSRTYGTSVLLPLTPSNSYDPRVIIMGGNSPATNTTEIIDLGASNPAWVYGPNMSQARIEMNAVILPNGKVLAVGGSINDEDTGSLSLNADLYDPGSNTFSSAGANASERLYHSVALLLPDATVWLAGGNPTRGSYNNTIEIYQPAYLFNPDGSLATRPSITAAPSSISYGNNFSVTTPDAANISSVVLVRNGTVTHAFGMDQREVALTFTAGNGTLTVTAPPNGNIAPPGYYMLFLLNSSGVPSVASFVQVNQVPPPPTNVTATAGNAQVGLSWSASSGATSYNVKRSTTNGGPYTTIASPTTTSYTDTGVTNGTTYYYVVSAVNTAGESANSSQVSATPQLAVVPPPPTNLAATAGNAQVALSWSASSGATSYNVQRSTTSGGPYTSIATPTTTSYTDTGVTNGTTYYYVVAAVNGAGQSANSSQVSATPQQTISFVQAIAGASSGSAQSLSLSFSQNTLAGDLILVAFDYDTKSTPSSVTDSQGNVFTAVGSQLTSPGGARSRVYYATSITGGTDTVKVNLSANSAWIELYLTEYSGASQTNPIDTQQGASGNAGSVSSGNGTTTVAGDRIFGYCLADDTCNAGPGFTARSTFHSNLIEDMLAGSPGSYAATGSANNGWTMQMLAIKPAVVTNPPPTPTNLVATAGNKQVALSWSASSGATSYNVQRSTTNGGPYTSIATPTTTSYTDTSVTNGTTYYYVVAAVNSAGQSANSSQVSATPQPGIPPVPTNLVATAGNAQVGLSWSASSGATSYNVKRSTTNGGPYTTIASPTTTSYTDTGVTNGTTYYYVVSAVNTAGESANSSQVSATPQLAVVPPPPTNLAATAGNAQVALSWSASSGATSYNVQRSTTSGGPYTSIATPTTTSYTDTGVTNGTTYYYVVAAVNGAGQSANSSQVSATPQQTISFVQAIAGASSGSAQSLSLSFSQNTLAGDLILVAFDYDTKSTPSSVTDSQGNVFTAVGSQLTSPGGARSRVYYATSITGGTDTVKVNLSANSAWIELYLTEYSGASQTNPIDTQQGASGNAGSVSSGNGTTTVAGDRIFGNCLADDTCNAGPGFTARSTFHSNLIEDMLAGSPGSYAATGSANNGWTMQMLAIKPAVVTNPPPTPTNLVATAGNKQVALSWSASSGATSYNVQRSTTNGGPYTSIATPTTTSYTDTSVTNGTTYYYVVAAVNSAGQSANSSQVSATPQLAVPPPPTNLVATAGNAQVGLSWSASSGATSYNVQRSTTSGGPYTSIATPTTTSYTDTGLTNGTTYYYVVAAVNAAGQSANSSQVSATPTASNGNLASLIGDQFADISGSSFSTLTTKIGISVPAGSAIVMAARANVGTCPTYNNAGGAATYHFTDSAGDVFSAAGCQVGSGATFSVMMGYVCNSAGGTAVTGTLNLGTAQTYPAVYMLAISNAQSASCFDTLISGSGTGSTTLTSGTFSTAQAQEIAVVLGTQTNTRQAFSAGAGGVFQGVDGSGSGGGMGGVETFSYNSIQSGVTVSMTQDSSHAWGMIGGAFKVANSIIAAPPANSVVPYVAGNTNVGSSSSTAVSIPSSYKNGTGIPAGHGVAIWAFNASNLCSGAACCLKVTDSEGNAYTTNTSSYYNSFLGTEYLATGKVTTSLKGDGTDTVTCSFYKSNCSTVIGGTTLYCRVFDVPQFASVDNASTPGTTSYTAGAVTVTSGTDIIWAIWDEAGTSAIQDPCLGYNLDLAQIDGGGGTQLAESTQSPHGVNPCGASGASGGTWGAALSIVP